MLTQLSQLRRADRKVNSTRSQKRFIMDYDKLARRGEVDVELDAVYAVLVRKSKRGEGILRCLRTHATVCKDERALAASSVDERRERRLPHSCVRSSASIFSLSF
jgi:hypothetical protein